MLLRSAAQSFFTVAGLSAAMLVSGCASNKVDPVVEAQLQESVLSPGRSVAEVTLLTAQNQRIRLKDLYASGPIVVTFYRGGWCTYCNDALKEWDGKLDELRATGADFIAITPESPEFALKTGDENEVDFTILSDPDNSAAQAFGVGFQLDPATISRYRGFGINLASTNASGQWTLPHPGTFIIDRDGIVRYSYVSADFVNGRADPDQVIAALRELNLR